MIKSRQNDEGLWNWQLKGYSSLDALTGLGVFSRLQNPVLGVQYMPSISCFRKEGKWVI